MCRTILVQFMLACWPDAGASGISDMAPGLQVTLSPIWLCCARFMRPVVAGGVGGPVAQQVACALTALKCRTARRQRGSCPLDQCRTEEVRDGGRLQR